MSSWKEMKMDGKTVIITGANRGIGRETAFQMATRGAKVIMACRDVTMAYDVQKELIEETGNRNIRVKKLDLGSLLSVRNFAMDILEKENRLDIMICNAGSFFGEKALTDDGLERTFEINYLSHFLLVVLLVPLLKRSQSSRVIMLSSLLYVLGSIDFNNLNAEKSFGTITTYGNAKLAVILFVKELTKRLRGTGVTINAVHPGVIKTNLTTQVNRFWQTLVSLGRWFIGDVKSGAQTSVYLAVSEDVAEQSGNLYYWCRKIPTTPHAGNMDIAKALWDRSCELVKLNPDACI